MTTSFSNLEKDHAIKILTNQLLDNISELNFLKNRIIGLESDIKYHEKCRRVLVDRLIEILFPCIHNDKTLCIDKLYLIQDHKDKKYGIVIKNFGEKIITCLMQDGSKRKVNSYKKDWIL